MDLLEEIDAMIAREPRPLDRDEYLALLARRDAEAEERQRQKDQANLFAVLWFLAAIGICVIVGLVGKPLLLW